MQILQDRRTVYFFVRQERYDVTHKKILKNIMVSQSTSNAHVLLKHTQKKKKKVQKFVEINDSSSSKVRLQINFIRRL